MRPASEDVRSAIHPGMPRKTQEYLHLFADILDLLVKPGFPWQPIETAPRDGTLIVVCMASNPPFLLALARRGKNDSGWETPPEYHDDGEWGFSRDRDWPMTHWLPLPPIPKPKKRDPA